MNGDARDWKYRHYVATALQILPEGNRQMSLSLEEYIHPASIDTRTGEEIAKDVIKRAGLSEKE